LSRRLKFNRSHPRARKFRPHLRATLAAGGADEIRLDVRQPDMIGPAVGADGDVEAATMVAAISTSRTPEVRI